MDDIIKKMDNAIIAGAEGISSFDLNDNTDLIDDLSFDSISIISLVVNLEIEFNIEIPDDFLLLENLRSYSRIKNLIFSLMAEKEALYGEGERNV